MSTYASTYRSLLGLALPLVLIQICQASLGLVDTMVAGQYHYQDLAGVGLGSAMWTPVFILLTGIMFVLVPKISGLGSDEKRADIPLLFMKGKVLAIWLSFVGFILIQLLAFLAPLMISDPAVESITKNYLHLVAFAMPAFVHVLLYRFVSEGRSQLGPIVKVFLVLLIVNSLMNLVFVFGVAGFEGLGGVGCGMATTLSAYVALFMLKRLVEKAVPEICHKPKGAVLNDEAKALLKEGLPIGVAFVVEVLALTALAFFAASLGVKQVAAHQIAINIAMVVFMIPVALSSAATICIASVQSANTLVEKGKFARASIIMSVVYGLIIAAIIICFGHLILSFFSSDNVVLAMTSSLLVYIALFQLFDAIQIVLAGVLRGLQEFVSPLLVIFVVYWLGVVPASSFVVSDQGLWFFSSGIESIWLLLSIGIAFAALVLSAISVKRLTRSHEPVLGVQGT